MVNFSSIFFQRMSLAVGAVLLAAAIVDIVLWTKV